MLPLEATGQSPHKMADSENSKGARTNPLLGRSFIFEGLNRQREGAKKFEAKNETEQAEGPSAGVTGYGFASPNTKPMGELQFPEAKQAISSDEQATHVRQVENILMNNKIPRSAYKVYNAVGDWGADGGYGAENSSVHVIKHPTDWQTMRKAAAQIGLLKKQLSVLVFQPKADGKSVLHRLYVPSGFSPEHIRESLRVAGIYHRTIVPAPDGAHVVFVVEPEKHVNPDMARITNKLAEELGGHKVDRTNGESEFVGQKDHDGESEWTFEHHSRPRYKSILAGKDGQAKV